MVSLFFIFILYFFASKWKFEQLRLQASLVEGFRVVLRLQWTSKSSDFVKDILQKSTCKASSKVLLSGFQTAQVSKMELEGAPKASHEPWFESSCTFWTPRGATWRSRRAAEQIILWFIKILISFSTDFHDFWNAPLLSWIQIQLPADVQVTFNS